MQSDERTNGGPPEGGRDGGEAGRVVLALGEVGEAREDEHAECEEEHEQAELLVRALQREAERLQARRVARELQHAQDAQHAEQLEHAAYVRDRLGARPVYLDQEERDVEGQDRDHVHRVQELQQKLALPRSHQEPVRAQAEHRMHFSYTQSTGSRLTRQ